jgi:hypothetical protein
MRVLFVRQARKRLAVRNILARRSALRIPLLVDNAEVDVQGNTESDDDALEAHHGRLCWCVSRSIPSLERLRTDDVANGKGGIQNGGGRALLRVASDVGSDPGELDGNSGEDGGDQVDSSQEPSLVGLGQVCHQSRTDDGWDADEDQGEPAVVEESHKGRGDEAHGDGNCAASHVEQCTSLGGVTEALDQCGAVSGNNTAACNPKQVSQRVTRLNSPRIMGIRTTTLKKHNKPLNPQLEVHERFLQLARREMVIFNTSLVDLDMLQQRYLLLIGKESGLHRRVRDEKPDESCED